METLQSGEKLTGVLEALEKNQTQQLQLMNQFMNTFMQAMQSKDKQFSSWIITSEHYLQLAVIL